jgi:hypothetical protein
MTPEEARKVLSSEPPCEDSTPGAIRRWSDRYAEAWMVQSGAPPERIKAAMEHLRGQGLDELGAPSAGSVSSIRGG